MWGSAQNLKVKVKYPNAENLGKHMLLQRIDTSISTLKHMSHRHFEKTEQVMTNTLNVLEKMVDHIDSVLDKIVLGKKETASSADP